MPTNDASIAKPIRRIPPSPRCTSNTFAPLKHGGSDDDSNLCLACIDCNLHKGSNLTDVDPLTDAVTLLFHPRQQRREDHFHWEGIIVVGRSDVGRTTLRVLCMNCDEQLELRMVGE